MEPEISIVVPLYEAEDRVLALFDAVTAERDRLPPFELILVDDGSTDSTWPLVSALAERAPGTVGVRLASNFGQTGALCAGFSVARGDVVVMMDDDLDCGPAEIPRFVEAVRAGAEFASGWRRGTREPVRHLGSMLYNARIRRWGLPFRDAGCGTNALTKDLARQLVDAGWAVRQHRFKPTVARLTDRIVEVPFEVRPTTTSHHNVRSLAASWLDVEMTFGSMTSARYVAVAVLSPLLLAAWLAVQVARRPRHRIARALGVATLGAIGGFALDVLSVRLRQDRRDAARPPFVIAERTTAFASS